MSRVIGMARPVRLAGARDCAVSKRRLVITAVLAGASQSEVARTYGVSQGWISRLMARYRAEGEAAFEPRSRAPRSSPAAAAEETVQLVVEIRKKLAEQGLDAGADTIVWHLQHRHDTELSRATVVRHLTGSGLVVPEPRKRPTSSFIRFAAEQPNECWQSDVTHYRLTNPDGTRGADVEVITWLDDHSRYALSVTAHHRVTGPIVLATFGQTIAAHGIPASTLTDIQSGWRGIRADLSAGGEDRCRPAPARHRCLTEWSAQRLLAC